MLWIWLLSEIWKKLKVPNVLRCKIRKYPFRVSCPPSVCPVITIRMLGAWETFAQRQKNDNRPSPSIADEQSSEAKKVKPVKGEKIDRKDILKNKNIHQKKDATSFFETCTSSRWNLLHLFLKGAMCFWKRCYVFKQTGVTNWWRYMDFDWHCHNLFFHDYKVGLFERKPYIWK